MDNQEWQEKYNTMRIFYEDRLKHLDDMLTKSMEMNVKLVGMLQDNRSDYKVGPDNPWRQVKPFDGRAAGQKVYDGSCPICGLKGINGYVCQNPNCPGLVAFNVSTGI